jgi:hypothetical protein
MSTAAIPPTMKTRQEPEKETACGSRGEGRTYS